MLVVFVAGYLSASFIDVRQLMAWVNTQTAATNSLNATRQVAQQNSQLPKPKLEFYTLLTANHAASATAQAATHNPAVVPQPLNKASELAAAKAKTVVTPLTPAAVTKIIAQSTKKLPIPRVTQPMVNKLNYAIQVAAFRTRQDAEQMKASLLLKGFEANVQAIASGRVTWFRVMVGPFASRELAVKTQTVLARRERVSGMIRQMNV